MRNHIQNLFRLTNLQELDFSYKLVSFDLKPLEGKEDLFNKQLRKIAQAIASETGGPAVVVKRETSVYIAIPATSHAPDMKIDTTPFVVQIKTLPEIYTIKPRELGQANNLAVAQKFIDFEIRRQLGKHKKLWKLNNGQFLFKAPIQSNDESSIEIFGGFSYKLECIYGQLYVCLNLTTKYADKNYLSKYVNKGNADTLIGRLRGKRAIYQNGDNWYAIEIEGFGKSIRDHEFTYRDETHNVFDFITRETSHHTFKAASMIQPGDITVLYSYPGRSMEPHSGAASLARILFSTQDQQVKSLHRFSIKTPSKRFDGITANIKEYFQDIVFGSTKIGISTAPVTEQLSAFPMPELKYNNDRRLKVAPFAAGGNTTLSEYSAERKQYIVDNGILNKSAFDEQFLIVPDYLEKELVEAFKKNAEFQVKKLAPAFGAFKVLRYKAKTNQSATFQIQEIEKTLQQNNALSGFALFILPDIGYDAKKQVKNFHDCLKGKFYPGLKVQCASAAKIRTFFQVFESSLNKGVTEYKVPEDKKPAFKNYLFNLVMEHLIVNRKWPFALAKNLHYDIYIGIDVHDRYAGFTFFFKNGENILFFNVQVPRKNRSQRAEKLKAGLLYEMMYDKLKTYIPRFAPNPNGIVILRDGRSFGEEQKALNMTIAALAADGLLQKETLKYGVVDIHKQSAVPFRVALQTDSYQKLENPVAGTFRCFDHKEGFIFNTGFPFQIGGTAKPLHLHMQSGNLIFRNVMEDVFCQSMMAFSAPDRSNSLPVAIKLIDTLLEPLTAASEIVEEDEEEVAETNVDNA